MQAQIRLFSGKLVDLHSLQASDIDIKDIAHALSNLCRFCGHTRRFYSVAQHSVYIARRMPLDCALWGLLHDASEAYLSDVVSPLKRLAEYQHYRDLEATVMLRVCERFGLSSFEPDCVKLADRRMLATEQRDLVNGASCDGDPYPFTVHPMLPDAAEALFLMTYEEVRHYA